jgi:hypothetical protein
VRIALVTADIGRFDEYYKPPSSDGVDYFRYTEGNLPAPLPNLNNRLKGKYIKMMTHRFLPDYDVYIWVDGNVEVKNIDEFVSMMIGGIEDMKLPLHPKRLNVFDEIHYIKTKLSANDDYLTPRYKFEPWDDEEKFLRNHLTDTTLYNLRFFSRVNSEKVNKAFEEWWLKTLEFCNFDQTMFSYIRESFDLKVEKLDFNSVKSININKHLI